jgi:hypothetical protein
MKIQKITEIIKFIPEFLWSLIVYSYFSRKYRYIDYFEYKKLATPNFLEPKGFNAVCHYGNYRCVAKLTGRRFNFITDYIEHGCNFHTEPEYMKYLGYYNRPLIKRIYVMSHLIVSTYNQCIKQENLKSKAIAVGPYILGADFFHTKDKLEEIKKTYGKILLVFPTHSNEYNTSDFDVNNFIDEICRVKNKGNFDSVFVCLYYADILKGRDESYLQNGFTIVCNGHRSDPRFNNRQKDLIYLADHTLSNDIGDYIGYSITMGKPHYLYTQSVKFITREGKLQFQTPSYKEATNRFQQIFGVFTESITPEQKELVEKYYF